MVVYVLTENWQLDDGNYGLNTHVYSSFKKGLKEFEKATKDAMKDMRHLAIEVENNGEKGEYATFSVYESGNYCLNHIDIYLDKREIL